jgi:hypothetical protein
LQKFTEVFASQGAPPVLTTPAANLPLVSTTPVAKLLSVSSTPAAKFATNTASVIDTGSKFVNDTGGK